jgi:hypothetical protein
MAHVISQLIYAWKGLTKAWPLTVRLLRVRRNALFLSQVRRLRGICLPCFNMLVPEAQSL